MPISPRASEIGLPALRASSRASSSTFSSSAFARRCSRAERSAGATARQAGKASFARETAASVSSTPAWGTSAMTSAVAGSTNLDQPDASRSRGSGRARDRASSTSAPTTRLRSSSSGCQSTPTANALSGSSIASTSPSSAQPARDDALAELIEPLVVRRLHLGALGADHPRRQRARLEPDAVVREHAGRVPVEREIVEMLGERPALDHVQHLHAAADAQHGHVALERARAEAELEAVALRPGRADLRMRLRAVGGGVDVGAAREDQAVEHVEHLVGTLGEHVVGRQDQRHPARAVAPIASSCAARG